jgi:hypothetical protein
VYPSLDIEMGDQVEDVGVAQPPEGRLANPRGV